MMAVAPPAGQIALPLDKNSYGMAWWTWHQTHPASKIPIGSNIFVTDQGGLTSLPTEPKGFPAEHFYCNMVINIIHLSY